MTKPKYQWCFDEWAKFSIWQAWKDAGSHKPRPAGLWTRVPDWAWKLLGEWHKKHPVTPPHPQPPAEPVSPWKNPPWRGIGLHTTWAFTSGQYSPQQLADRIAGTRVQWSVLEGSPADNEPYMKAYRDALLGHGKRFGIWERADRQKNYPESYTDHAKRLIETYLEGGDNPNFFYGADVEEFPIDDPAFPALLAKAYPNLPRIAIIPGLPDASYLQTWWDNGWDLMTEDYAANIGQPSVPGIGGATDHDAYWRGSRRNFIKSPVVNGQTWGALWWQHGSGPHTVKIIEVNGEGNPDLAAQLESDAVKWFGGNYSIWNAEQLSDDDWRLLAS